MAFCNAQDVSIYTILVSCCLSSVFLFAWYILVFSSFCFSLSLNVLIIYISPPITPESITCSHKCQLISFTASTLTTIISKASSTFPSYLCHGILLFFFYFLATLLIVCNLRLTTKNWIHLKDNTYFFSSRCLCVYLCISHIM